MKVKDTGKGDFEQPEPGSYAATCNRIIDIGTQVGEYQGKQTSRKQFIMGWELDEKMSDGKPFMVSKFYTASLNEKAALRKDLGGWRGRTFSEEELQGFDIKQMLGLTCLLSLIQKEKGNGVKVATVSKLPKGMMPPAIVNPVIYFSLEAGEFKQEVLDGLSEGYKNLIIKSPEYIGLMSGAPAEEEEVKF